MKKMQSIVLALSLVLVAPMAAQAAEITLVPSVKLQIGDRDNRGYYWDGGHWRDHGWCCLLYTSDAADDYTWV